MKQYTRVLVLAAAMLAIPMGAAVAQTRTTTDSSIDRWTPRQDAVFERGFYAGGGLGYFQLEDEDFFDDLDDDQIAYKLYGGADILSWLSAEVGYVNFGELGGSANLEADGWTVAALAHLPIGYFAPYVKVGHFWWDADVDGGSEDSTDWFGGAGLRFALTDNLDLRTEYERYRFDEGAADTDVDMVSLNLQYDF